MIIEAWNGTSWTQIDSLHVNDGGWTNYGDTLSSFTYGANLVKIRFRAESGGDADDYYQDQLLDDISIIEAPTCPIPKSLMASNITSTSADISWVELDSATYWMIEYGITGFAL